MLFNSFEFICVFLPVTLLVYFSLAKFRLTKLAILSLVIASLCFYSYWDIRYLPLLICSIIFNYFIGSLLEKNRQKTTLFFGVLMNLALLGYFKYTGFFLHAVNDIFSASLFIPNIVLPLGISFFTFTQTAYLVDVYRGETPHYPFLTYCLFVTIFPHLIAGPILYHKDMIPQFLRLRNFIFSYKNFSLGFALFSLGLFKKVVLADGLFPLVKGVFDHAQDLSFIEAWGGAIGYTLQLYFDFSGYSEMALGLGLMLNFKLPVNFDSPYQATSIIDFWRRWHITLSAFLKNYLYIPLGGNHNGQFMKIRNLMITMLLGGLWHGAGWTFIIWGGLHGLYLTINHLWRNATSFTLPRFVSHTLTFLCVVVAWVFFRATSVSDALAILQAMVGMHAIVLPPGSFLKSAFLLNHGVRFETLQYLVGGTRQLIIMTIWLIIVFRVKNPIEWIKTFQPNWKWSLVIALMMAYSILSLTKASEFLYFQF